jgi:hypothetical protein
VTRNRSDFEKKIARCRTFSRENPKKFTAKVPHRANVSNTDGNRQSPNTRNRVTRNRSDFEKNRPARDLQPRKSEEIHGESNAPGKPSSRRTRENRQSPNTRNRVTRNRSKVEKARGGRRSYGLPALVPAAEDVFV